MIILGQQKAIVVSIWWYWISMGRYWLALWVLGQYNLVLLGIKWNLVSVGLLCQYILKNMEIYSDVTIAGRRDKRTRKDRATQSMDHGRLR